jgi:hypothetical protein
MTAMTTRRWTKAGITWFAIGGVAPELTAPAEQVLMDYQHSGDEWRHGYPADTPGLDVCWRNFARCAELMLRQAARLQPGVDSPSPADFGPIPASRLETVTWEGWQLRVPPLDLQRAASERRGRTDRVALIDAMLHR